MKVSISIQRDTHNTFPTATVDFWPSDESVTIKFSDSDRQVSVLASDLLKIAELIRK